MEYRFTYDNEITYARLKESMWKPIPACYENGFFEVEVVYIDRTNLILSLLMKEHDLKDRFDSFYRKGLLYFDFSYRLQMMYRGDDPTTIALLSFHIIPSKFYLSLLNDGNDYI